jgi:hypothetical protein
LVDHVVLAPLARVETEDDVRRNELVNGRVVRDRVLEL